MKSAKRWRIALWTLTAILMLFSVRWSLMDRSPPRWDESMYLVQAKIFNIVLKESGPLKLIPFVLENDRGRVSFLPLSVQPSYVLFGESMDIAVITMNIFCWLILAWSIAGLTKLISNNHPAADKAAFFAFATFSLHPLTTILSHYFLVEFPLVAFCCATIYSLLKLHQTDQRKWSVASGIFIGLGLMTKVTFPVFFLPAATVLLFFEFKVKSKSQALRNSLPALLISLLIAGPNYIYNLLPIIDNTRFLSSQKLATLHGFGEVFDIHNILKYWKDIFLIPSAAAAILGVP